MAKTAAHRPSYLSRLWRELGTIGGEHDAFIKVIIVERIVKSVVLLLGAIGLLVAGRNGWLDQWGDYAENQLNLEVGHNFLVNDGTAERMETVLLLVPSSKPADMPAQASATK